MNTHTAGATPTPRTNPTLNAYRAGLRRGMISTRISLTTTSDVLGTVIPLVLFVAALIFMQRFEFEGSEVSLGVMVLPGMLAMAVFYGAYRAKLHLVDYSTSL